MYRKSWASDLLAYIAKQKIRQRTTWTRGLAMVPIRLYSVRACEIVVPHAAVERDKVTEEFVLAVDKNRCRLTPTIGPYFCQILHAAPQVLVQALLLLDPLWCETVLLQEGKAQSIACVQERVVSIDIF